MSAQGVYRSPLDPGSERLAVFVGSRHAPNMIVVKCIKQLEKRFL
jgi:hypothetical protein